MTSDDHMGWAHPTVFGVAIDMPRARAVQLRADLQAIWQTQLTSLSEARFHRSRYRMGRDIVELEEDLEVLRAWFDPVASGKRLRDLLALLDETPVKGEVSGDLIFHVGEGRSLLTLEGRAVLWLLDGAVPAVHGHPDVFLQPEACQQAERAVHETYRRWVLHRITGVTSLLNDDSSSLQPTAAGLLLVLLVNRNTAPSRRLPAPRDPQRLQQVGEAIAAPALAFARALSGRPSGTVQGLNLYRGWALGELARRLGSALHRDADGIWIAEEHADAALSRLVDSLRDRPTEVRSRVPQAVQAALHEYERKRGLLNSLGIAYERPSNTRHIVEQMNLAAVDSGER